MKKLTVLFVSLSMAFSAVSCSDDDSTPNNNNNLNQDLIHGWWYATDENEGPRYKGYYFGEDGEFKQDMSNFGLGMGTGTWEWEDSNTLKMTPDPDGGIMGGEQKPEVEELTQDRLVLSILGQEVILDRTED